MLLALKLALAVLLLGSMQPPAMAAEKVVVSHFPGSVMSLPIYVAYEKGYYKNHGLDVTLAGIAGGPDAVAAVISGSVDFMVNSGDNLMRVMQTGSPPLKIVVGNLGQIPFTVIAHKDMPTPNKSKGYPAALTDLKGKVMGIQARGGSVEFFMRAMFKDAGMDPDKDVRWASVGPPPTALPAMVNKQIDAYLAFEPFQTKALSELKVGQVLVDLRKGEGPREFRNFPYNFYSGRADRIAARPEMVRNFVAAMVEAHKFIADPANTDELTQIAGKYINMDKALLKQMLIDNRGTFSPYVPAEGLQRWIEFARDAMGLNKKNFTPQELIAADFLPKAP
jgi:ABC-type nitrate/sulfonate/bicarbonate transport system substrate-binding protein